MAVKRRSSTEELYLAVERSEFVGCRAMQAGALFLQSISFTIESSVFISNTAEQTGGGIYAAIKLWHTGLISNSRFAKNSVSEGGAVMHPYYLLISSFSKTPLLMDLYRFIWSDTFLSHSLGRQ